MLDEKIILEESEVKFEHRLNNVFGNNRPISFNTKYTALNSGNHGEIILYNKNKEHVPQRIKLDNNDILDLEFSPFNNEHLALYTKNNIISIYDLSEYNENDDQMKPKYTLNPKNEITLMTFNPAKSNILCICDKKGNMCIWDINADKTFNQLNQENDSTGLLWSPNGNLIAICFNDGLLKIYNNVDNIYKNISLIKEHNKRINYCLELNINIILTCSLDYTMKIIILENEMNYKINQILTSHKDSVLKSIKIKDNCIISLSRDNEFIIWNLNNKNNLYYNETRVIYQKTNSYCNILKIKENEIIISNQKEESLKIL